jgi:acyl-coenzyme A thioesterase PaaI-like protein
MGGVAWSRIDQGTHVNDGAAEDKVSDRTEYSRMSIKLAMIERISQRLVAQAIGRPQRLLSPLLSSPNHTIRFHLSYSIYRFSHPYSTVQTSGTHEKTPPTPAEPPERAFRKPKRSVRPYIFASFCFLIGITAGQYVKLIIAPPPLPAPGTPEDASLTAYIHKLASKLPIVRSLSSDPAWCSWDAYSTLSPEEKGQRITSGALAGSRGIGGYQRIFHNAETGDFVSVVWIGGATTSWPGVTHGGLIATLMDESLGRCAFSRFSAKTGVTANLEIDYLAPTVTNTFVVIRVAPVLEGSTNRKGFVAGRLETLEGKVCVKAKGLFIVPKKIRQDQLSRIELKDLTQGF